MCVYLRKINEVRTFSWVLFNEQKTDKYYEIDWKLCLLSFSFLGSMPLIWRLFHSTKKLTLTWCYKRLGIFVFYLFLEQKCWHNRSQIFCVDFILFFQTDSVISHAFKAHLIKLQPRECVWIFFVLTLISIHFLFLKIINTKHTRLIRVILCPIILDEKSDFQNTIWIIVCLDPMFYFHELQYVHWFVTHKKQLILKPQFNIQIRTFCKLSFILASNLKL